MNCGPRPPELANTQIVTHPISGLVSNFLHYLSEEDTKSVTRLLGKWVLSALSISALSALPPGLNVRGLKAGERCPQVRGSPGEGGP